MSMASPLRREIVERLNSRPYKLTAVWRQVDHGLRAAEQADALNRRTREAVVKVIELRDQPELQEAAKREGRVLMQEAWHQSERAVKQLVDAVEQLRELFGDKR